MREEFNLQQTCNSLTLFFEKELGSKNIFKISLDVRLPIVLGGDVQPLRDSLIKTVLFLNSRLKNGLVEVEVLKAGQHNGTIRLNVIVRASDQKPVRASRFNSKETAKIIAELPLVPVFSFTSKFAQFSFAVEFKRSVENPSEETLVNKKILLVEDNELNSVVFLSFLEEWGCQVTKVESGKEAIVKAKTFEFDIILMDVYMPEMSGNMAIEKIREFDKDTPIIALTASTLKNDIKSSLEAGANDFLLKPVSSIQLKKILNKYF